MTYEIQQTRQSPGELLIWTNVDNTFEDDFNRWYDREHMEERAAIPGFIWARRYKSDNGKCPYLALYRTREVNIFLSAPYRKAFENQTSWSVTNFGRMFGTTRRVNIVTELIGKGAGSALALVQLGTLAVAEEVAQKIAALIGEDTGFISARILFPDPELSTPLPSPGANNFIEPFLIIEATSLEVVESLAKRTAENFSIGADKLTSFRMLWDLRSEDLAPGK